MSVRLAMAVLVLPLLLPLLLPQRGAAQSNVALDVAASRVTYDGFLESNALTVAPTFSFASPRTSALAGIVATVFESGSRSSIISLEGAWRAMALRRASLELHASTGASFYTYSESAADALAGARMRYGGRAAGFWAGADAGGQFGRAISAGLARIDLGAWWRAERATLRISALPTALNAVQFTDLTSDVSWRVRRLELAGVAGHRAATSPGVTASFGALSARMRITSSLDAGISWGRALPDLLRSSPGARYAAVSVRISSFPAQPPMRMRRRDDPRNARMSLHSVTLRGDTTVLLVRARGGESVEVSGDFTNWEPMALERSGEDQWRGAFLLRPGVYRYNVRMNGGEWTAPAGAGRMSDDFGGEAAVLVVQPQGG